MSERRCAHICKKYQRIAKDFSGPVATHPDVIVVPIDADPHDETTWIFEPSTEQKERAAENFKDIINLCDGPLEAGYCGAYPSSKCDERNVEHPAIYINIDNQVRSSN